MISARRTILSLRRSIKRHWLLALFQMNIEAITASGRIFWVMLFFTCVQHFIFFLVWVFFFAAVSDIQGWGLSEIALLQGFFGISIGLTSLFLGGLDMLAHQIHSGELDTHLARPRAILPSAIFSHTRVAAFGDFVYGILVIALFGELAFTQIPLLITMLVSICALVTAFKLLIHSLAFWGLSAYAADGGTGLLYVASTKPINGFGFWGKLAFLTILPAGYMALLPVEILRDFTTTTFLLQIGTCSGLLLLAIAFFHHGLKRYASGSRFILQR